MSCDWYVAAFSVWVKQDGLIYIIVVLAMMTFSSVGGA